MTLAAFVPVAGRGLSAGLALVLLSALPADAASTFADSRDSLLGTIANPDAAFVLLLVGIYALLLEFANPGTFLPGIVGIVSLALAALALSALPVQYGALALLVAGILVLSFYPKLLMDPVSAAIDPQFASTLVWEGMSLYTIYGYWNPIPVMMIAVGVAAVLGIVAWFFYRSGVHRSGHRARFYGYYRALIARMVPPLATGFWAGVRDVALAAAASFRRVYTGNGQTYALCVLLYFLALYGVSTGLAGFWIAA